MNPILPWSRAATPLGHKVDTLMLSLTALVSAVAIAVFVLIFLFCIRYRHGRKADRARDSESKRERIALRIEIAWAAIPLALFFVVFVWAADLYYDAHAAPQDAQQVFVVAKQWMWKLQHPEGRQEINELHVPRGHPVKLVMTSQDVIHSFFVPDFRTKQDVLPGRYTTLWFTAERTGSFHLFCAEYCGTDHSRMTGRLIVMEPEDFARWLTSGSGGSTMAQRGANLFRSLGCSGCHGHSTTVHAPPLNHLYGRVVPLASGGTAIADERYLRDSILLPSRDIAAGYSPVMPSYSGRVSEEEILELVAYIESLANMDAPP